MQNKPVRQPDPRKTVVVTGFEPRFGHVSGKDMLLRLHGYGSPLGKDLIQFIASSRPRAIYTSSINQNGRYTHVGRVLAEFGTEVIVNNDIPRLIKEKAQTEPEREMTTEDTKHLKAYLSFHIGGGYANPDNEGFRRVSEEIVKTFKAMGFPEAFTRKKLAEHVLALKAKTQ
ncbi:MAG: hypothetical protein JW834_02585 [Candidatus Diapherotrites archaeon]|nr:hypothetical protein [Candidatus Diapherotrites archaeon]